MSRRLTSSLFLTLMLVSTGGAAKGLEELGQQSPANPENQPEAAEEPASNPSKAPPKSSPPGAEPTPATPGVPAPTAAPAPKVQVRSAISKHLDKRLFVATSFNRALAWQSEGAWDSAGTSDITVGYKLPVEVLKGLGLFGTMRYSATDVSAEVDNFSYRGVLQGYQVGALASYGIVPNISLLASFELGYLVVYMNHIDDLDTDKNSPDDDGVLVTLGSGVDFTLLEKLAAGPRLNIGAGQFTIFEIGAGLTLMF